MYNLGLKLFSTNVEYYLHEAVKLYKNNIFDYIELYIVPDSLNCLYEWKKVNKEYNIPFIIHNAHFGGGFNLAKKECEKRNFEIYTQTKKYADTLNAKYIIFHGGIDGNIKETAIQLALFNEERALIENKPYLAIPNRMNGKFCRGYSIEEIMTVIDVANCGFCLDIGHGICAAVSMNLDIYEYIKQLIKLNPKMFHLTDNKNINSPYDTHVHLGEGELDFNEIKKILPENAIVTLETDKNSKENLDDYIDDVKFMRRLEKNGI